MGSLRASQLLLSSGSLLCRESLGESELSQDATNHSSIPKDAIILRQPAGGGRATLAQPTLRRQSDEHEGAVQLIVASSVNEEFCSEKEERKREEACRHAGEQKERDKKGRGEGIELATGHSVPCGAESERGGVLDLRQPLGEEGGEPQTTGPREEGR